MTAYLSSSVASIWRATGGAGRRQLAPAQEHAGDAHPLALRSSRSVASASDRQHDFPATPRRAHPCFPARQNRAGGLGGQSGAWLAHSEEVRRRHPAGESLRTIKKATGLARATVRHFARAENFPERAVRAPGLSMLDPFHLLAGRATIHWMRKRLVAATRLAAFARWMRQMYGRAKFDLLRRRLLLPS